MRRLLLAFTAILVLVSCGPTDTRKEIIKRRAALIEKQATELLRAQDDLRVTDSLLQLANQELSDLTGKVEEAKAALKATPEELTQLTMSRIRRDSLRTQFEVLGAKIRYIRQKQKEMKSEK